jgi:uncharacterized membrane protein (UPF0127 family)
MGCGWNVLFAGIEGMKIHIAQKTKKAACQYSQNNQLLELKADKFDATRIAIGSRAP